MHYSYLLDYTVEVFAVNNSKVLLRHHEKYNTWLGVGGHVDPGETPVDTAHREVMEEVGLKIELLSSQPLAKDLDVKYSPVEMPIAINRHNIAGQHDHLTFVYAAAANTADLLLPDGPEGAAECRWFTDSELDDLDGLSSTVKSYARAAIARASQE